MTRAHAESRSRQSSKGEASLTCAHRATRSPTLRAIAHAHRDGVARHPGQQDLSLRYAPSPMSLQSGRASPPAPIPFSHSEVAY